MQSAEAIHTDDFAAYVPAWRRAKLRRVLREAEADGKFGAPAEAGAHRAIARRHAAGFAARHGEASLPMRREQRLWQIIFAWRGTLGAPDYMPREIRSAAISEITLDFEDRGWDLPGRAQLRRMLDEPALEAVSFEEVVCVAQQTVDATKLRGLLGTFPPDHARRTNDLIRRTERQGRLTVLAPAVAHWLKGNLAGVSLAGRRRLRLRCEQGGLSAGGLFTEHGRQAIALYDALAGIARANSGPPVAVGFSSALPAAAPDRWL